MACYNYYWKGAGTTLSAGANICVSSQTNHIAVSVKAINVSDLYYRIFLDMYDTGSGEWVQMGYRSASSTSTTSYNNHDFQPTYTTVRTYRVRFVPYYPNGSWSWTSPSFTHKHSG